MIEYFRILASNPDIPRYTGDSGLIPGSENPLQKEMATHSSIVWKIPGTEEPGGLQSMGHKESDTTEQLSTHTQIPR